LVLCGHRFAGEVLNSISSEREGYQEAFTQAIVEIRQRADDLIANNSSGSVPTQRIS
jgi:hypothetical protein